MIRLKRVYEPPSPADGRRVLVERLWPRGLSKDKAAVDEWVKDVAPSPALRKWFGHDPDRWEEFSRQYRQELEDNPALEHVRSLVKQGPVTFVYAARDEQHNSARILKEYLEHA